MRSTMWVVLEGLVVLAGCRSGKNVTIVTNPDQAEVVAGGSSVGVTPYVVQKVKYDRGFELRKENYQPRSVTINSSSPGEVLVQLTPKLPEAAVKVTPKPPETAGQSIPEVTVGAQGFEVRHTPVYAEEEVIERSPNVKSVRRLTDMANTRWLGAFCLAPDDRTVVMEVLDEEQVEGGAKKQYSNLWAVSTVGGGGTQHVTQGKCFDSAPFFSPDGQFVYFSSSRVGKNNIWKIAANGVGGLGLVTSFTTADTCPQVSPDDYPTFSRDGKTVYFRSNRGLKWDIWVMELVGPSYAQAKSR